MKNKHVLILVLIMSLLLPSRLYATSWENEFVVWHDYSYVVKDEYVTEIGNKIGYVTKYSDMETYKGNFSNSFKKGTPYYSIRGISTDEAIAVRLEDGKYKLAIKSGKFVGERRDNTGLVENVIVISLIEIFAIYFIIRIRKGLTQK